MGKPSFLEHIMCSFRREFLVLALLMCMGGVIASSTHADGWEMQCWKCGLVKAKGVVSKSVKSRCIINCPFSGYIGPAQPRFGGKHEWVVPLSAASIPEMQCRKCGLMKAKGVASKSVKSRCIINCPFSGYTGTAQ